MLTKRLIALIPIAAIPCCSRTQTGDAMQLQQANQAYLTAQYSSAVRLADQFLASNGTSPDIAEAYYLRALAKIKQDQRTAAKTDLNKGLTANPRPEVRGRIHAQLGHLAFDDEQYSLARSYYSAALKDLPPVAPADDVLYHLAIAYQRDGQFQKAKPLFSQLTARFPSSRWTPKARQKTLWPNDFFTIQCGAFVSRSAAQQSVGQLRARGVEAALVNSTGMSSRHQLVCAGRYRTYREAEQALQRVRRIQNDAFIVP